MSMSFELTHAPLAKAEMLIRKPVAQVFEAFIHPAITSKFWFTKGSGRLEPGKHKHNIILNLVADRFPQGLE